MQAKETFLTRTEVANAKMRDMLPIIRVMAMTLRCKINRPKQLLYTWHMVQRAVMEN